MSKTDENENYTLTPWGCMLSVCADYDIDLSHLTPKMGEHMVNDFMDLMVRCGYVGKVGEKDEQMQRL